MGRRALPKVDPNIDLSFHWKRLEDLAAPLDIDALFGRSAPLELEIGSGKGMFLGNAAAAHPERNYLGTEIARQYARFAAARWARAGLANAIMIEGDALRFCRELVGNETVAALHVYFPDPWWKARHRKRRVMREEFIRDIERMLVPGGKLHFWTDVEEYFESTLELIAAISPLSGPHAVPIDETDEEYRTHFDRRMRLHDHEVFRSKFIKPQSNAGAEAPLP